MKKLFLGLMVCGIANVVAMDPCGIYIATKRDDIAHVNDMFDGENPYLEFEKFKNMLALHAAAHKSKNVIAYLQERGVDVHGIVAKHKESKANRAEAVKAFARQEKEEAAATEKRMAEEMRRSEIFYRQ